MGRSCTQRFCLHQLLVQERNANVLHYIENNQQCKAGDLILIDAGAGMGELLQRHDPYHSVSGKYGLIAKAVYNAVLRALKKRNAKMLLLPETIQNNTAEVGRV
jgi:Xaa-Pro aminopeptidase